MTLVFIARLQTIILAFNWDADVPREQRLHLTTVITEACGIN